MERLEAERNDFARRFYSIFSEHNAVMLLIEPISGKIVDANPSAVRFYGYSKEELIKMRIQDINILPDEEVAKYRMMALKEGRRYFVFPHRLKNGEVRLVDVFTSPVGIGGKKYLFSIIFDVTDREEIKKQLLYEKELFRVTILSIGDGVVTTDKNGAITTMNPVAEQITGWREEEAKGRPFSEVFKLISEATGKEVKNPIETVLRTGRTVGLANHTILIDKRGNKVPIADSASAIRDESRKLYGIVMVFRDVTHERQYQERIVYLSYHDQLTSLYNRRFMEEEIKRLEKLKDVPVAVIMADVNGLKLANDVFGHEEGDALLIRAAEIMRENCRKEDIIGRWGGDEFLILMPGAFSKDAGKVAERIRQACRMESGGK